LNDAPNTITGCTFKSFYRIRAGEASDVLASPTVDPRATGDHTFIDLVILQFSSSSSRKKNQFLVFYGIENQKIWECFGAFLD